MGVDFRADTIGVKLTELKVATRNPVPASVAATGWIP